jgi:hypothetical protein
LAAIAVNWSTLDAGTRLVYAALFVLGLGLGLSMRWRALRTRTRLVRQAEGGRPWYIDGIGFTLISQFDAFVIVGDRPQRAGTAGGRHRGGRRRARCAGDRAAQAEPGLKPSERALSVHHGQLEPDCLYRAQRQN